MSMPRDEPPVEGRFPADPPAKTAGKVPLLKLAGLDARTSHVAEKTAPRQRGRPFRKGQSGNPHGRPAGARNRSTLAVEALLDGEAERLTRKAVALALEGDVTCLRLCIDRVLPPRRDRPVLFTIPAMNSADDASKAMAAITTAVACGELTPTEAAELSRVIEAYVKAIEITEIERRLKIIEERQLARRAE
jgi:hypothetical protein